MTLAAELASSGRYDHVPGAVVDSIKARLLDTLGICGAALHQFTLALIDAALRLTALGTRAHDIA